MQRRLTPGQISEIKTLSKSGVSIRDISKNLRISRATVYYHAKGYCRKVTKLKLGLLNEHEKGYVIGLFLGDGSFNRGRKEPRFFVRFAFDLRRDKDVASRLAQVLEKSEKKVSIFPSGSTLTVKVCSKELVAYIEKCIEYRKGTDGEGEENLLVNKSWPSDFRYGVVAGLIDSDGHVHRHLGTEIKTVSRDVFISVLNILSDLKINVNARTREPKGNSYSKKPRYVIYIPSSQSKEHQNRIPSVKLRRT